MSTDIEQMADGRIRPDRPVQIGQADRPLAAMAVLVVLVVLLLRVRASLHAPSLTPIYPRDVAPLQLLWMYCLLMLAV
jgi:hypothetical protein